MQSTDDAVPSDLEYNLAMRFRQAVQGCTLHLHGPVAAFCEVQKQARDNGVRLDVVRELITTRSRMRQITLTAAGVSAADPRQRKELAVAEFTEALFRGAKMTTSMKTAADQLQENIRSHMAAVETHSLWSVITTPEALRVFMEHHVYCVWDFMSLLKSLQRQLTSIAIPWQPRGRPQPRQ